MSIIAKNETASVFAPALTHTHSTEQETPSLPFVAPSMPHARSLSDREIVARPLLPTGDVDERAEMRAILARRTSQARVDSVPRTSSPLTEIAPFPKLSLLSTDSSPLTDRTSSDESLGSEEETTLAPKDALALKLPHLSIDSGPLNTARASSGNSLDQERETTLTSGAFVLKPLHRSIGSSPASLKSPLKDEAPSNENVSAPATSTMFRLTWGQLKFPPSDSAEALLQTLKNVQERLYGIQKN